MHGECSLQPLTLEELSLAEVIMAGGFSFPSAKEALKHRRNDSKNKRKKPLLDTSHVNKVTGMQSTPSGSTKPSPKNSSAKRARISEDEDVVTLPFLLMFLYT